MQVYNVRISNSAQEMTRHGDLLFPIGVYNTDLKKNVMGYMPLHWHDEVQFALVIKGSVNFTLNNEQFIVPEGDGIFINSGIPHSAKPINDEDSQYICIDISPYFLADRSFIIFEKYVDRLLISVSQILFNKNIDWQKNVLKKIQKIYDEYVEEKNGFEITIKITILEILREVMLNHESGNMDDNNINYNRTSDERIKNVLNYIHKNYQQRIKLDDIADASNLSRSESCRFFKTMTGQTPFEYLLNYRINASFKILRETDLPITEVAQEVGFGSVSYFIEQFRKMTKITPLQFRKSSFTENE
ncbi:MAG: AraC family transcriptional regulator [Tissierellia bacterium]|jgi:AraC-like DNA-binding protein|nr:AraC family transcriptional regulator [Tissierellia bacterium]